MDKPERLFDVRTVRRNIAAGLVTEDEYQAYLASLADDSDKQEQTKVNFVHRLAGDEDDDA